MAERVICDLCGATIPPHEHFIVRIDVFADPSIPAVSSEELAHTDFDATMSDLMKQMQGMSADDLMDGVHRRFEYRLCATCQKEYLANPLGRPRRTKPGEN